MPSGVRKDLKYVQVFNYVHDRIVNGQLKLGDRIPSETVLARKFTTTRVTVAKALRQLAHAGFLDRRQGSGSFVRQVRQADTKLLGLLVPALGEVEIFEPICSAIASSVHAHNFTLLWGRSSSTSSSDRAQQTRELCRKYIAQGVSGVFFSPAELSPGLEELNQQIVELLDRSGISVVLLDCDVVAFPQRSKFDLVGIDNRRAGRMLAEHLLEQGCRRIHYVYRPFSAATWFARLSGFHEALLAHGLTPTADLQHCGETHDIEFVRSLLGVNADAFICANDYTAVELMRNLFALGLRVPEDVRVVGVDDLKYAHLLSVPLTTIHQPFAEIGNAAVKAMLQRMEHPSQRSRDILLDVNLNVGMSSVLPQSRPAVAETSGAGKSQSKKTSRPSPNLA